MENEIRLHALTKHLLQIALGLSITEKEIYPSLAFRRISRRIPLYAEEIPPLIQNQKLQALPGIGEGIASVILEFWSTGNSTRLARLKEKLPSLVFELFDAGIGMGLVSRIFRHRLYQNRRALQCDLLSSRLQKELSLRQQDLRSLRAWLLPEAEYSDFILPAPLSSLIWLQWGNPDLPKALESIPFLVVSSKFNLNKPTLKIPWPEPLAGNSSPLPLNLNLPEFYAESPPISPLPPLMGLILHPCFNAWNLDLIKKIQSADTLVWFGLIGEVEPLNMRSMLGWASSLIQAERIFNFMPPEAIFSYLRSRVKAKESCQI